MMKVNVELEIQLPRIPNYFRTNPENDVSSIELRKLSEEQVEQFIAEYGNKVREVWRKKILDHKLSNSA